MSNLLSRYAPARPLRWLTPGLMLLLTACSSTQLARSWQEPSFTGPPIKKVMVMGLFHDPLDRRFFEDEFVDKFDTAGVDAIASYTLIPNPEDYDEEKEVAAAITKAGVDAVLIAELKAIDKQEKYVPPTVDWVGGPSLYGGGFYGHYYQSYRTVYRPGYKKIDTVAQVETRLYEIADNKLIWAGKTESMNPDSARKAIREIASTLTKDMKQRGILK